MHIIGDNDLFHRLAFDNPWWELKPDTRIQFKNPPKRIYYDAFFERLTGTKSGQILALAGPLRAGKTVMLRQAVSGLIEQGIKPTTGKSQPMFYRLFRFWSFCVFANLKRPCLAMHPFRRTQRWRFGRMRCLL